MGAYYQNGVAERTIQVVSESASLLLVHATLHWPGQVSLKICSRGVAYLVYLYNRMAQ